MTMQETQYFRASLGMKQEIAPAIAADYHSGIVNWLRANGHELQLPGLRIRLAKEFGFCYGVDKAVDMAYEARLKFPDRRIILTYEIIHNPSVNQRLKQMGIVFLSGALKDNITSDDIGPSDVVLLPAFGVPVSDLEKLRAKGCVLVDTTCGSVVHVWKRVERYARDGYTSLVHGKATHAETLATVSQAQNRGGATIVVRDMEETELVCDAIRGKRPMADVMSLGPKAFSAGFDPELHLQRIGVANQTTMLASESLAIARRVEAALSDRHGAENLAAHFRSFDTICSATQERQDAIIALVESGDLDMALIVGGYNSSNTGHLLEIAGEKTKAYHICDAGELIDRDRIRHRPPGAKETVITEAWLPAHDLTIGITAGASTPNRAIGETIQRLVELRGLVIPSEVLNCSG
ncbi:4-hydroxy-3-methylbut-2-enyl diphosphate reductase [bacterium]|nr:4-hydroxy-3-methylbut-2-enyl diphosphate reductase [bacterium]